MPSQEFVAFLAAVTASGLGDPDVTVEQERAGIEALGGSLLVVPGTVAEPVDMLGVPGEWVSAPGTGLSPVVFYLHGGAYTSGSLRSHHAVSAKLSELTGGRTLAVDYRLAPENPHPAAVEDVVSAWKWLLQQGIDPAGVVAGGDSAGAGLAVAMLTVLRDEDIALPAGVFGLSAWTDLAVEGASVTERADRDPVVQLRQIHRVAGLYLNGQDPKLPLASPLYADLSGLPPMYLQVGTEEVLYDDSTRLAERARAAGVEVQLDEWDGMVHTFSVFVGMFPEATESLHRVAQFVQARTGVRA